MDPSFHSQELTDLCATLQIRLEAPLNLTATHHRCLHTGADSDRVPQRTYDPEATKRHFKLHLISFSLARPVVFLLGLSKLTR